MFDNKLHCIESVVVRVHEPRKKKEQIPQIFLFVYQSSYIFLIIMDQQTSGTPEPNQTGVETEQKQNQQADIFAILKTGKQLAPVINEKLKRCRDFKDQQGPIPMSFRGISVCSMQENTPKEELVLEHVIQFKRQFQLHYDEKRELFLYPKNECDVYKFICTTIRPQKVGFLELYNYDKCAQYLSYFISYEQLDPPDRFPQCIPSPSNVAMWQKGDCFDLSILLCSLLVGVGYDAYCVYGIAPRSVTSRNESDLDYLYEDKGVTKDDSNQVNEEEELLKGNEFAILKKPEILSKFDTKKAEHDRLKKEEEERIALTIDDDEPDEMGPDPYAGRRIHCWVLIKGEQRNVERPFFIEPTTGRIYPIAESPYLSVDAVFNHKNFWVNMKYDCAVKDLNFNEMNTSMNWEYVMLDTLVEMAIQQEEEAHNEIAEGDGVALQNNKNNGNDPESQQLKEIAQLLDMPPPWPPKLFVDKERFLRGTPLGECTVFYKKCKVDQYAPYGQHDGLVLKITLYHDYKRLKVKEIRYFYEHRSDKLVMKRRFPYEFKTVQDYAPGRMPHWKQIITIDRRLRILKYYPNRNQDGLIKRIEQVGEKTIEFYEGRDDKVVYRSVRFDPNKKTFTPRDYTYPDNNMGMVLVEKMTQKFAKNPYVPANEQIAKMVINLKKNVVYVYFHMNEGEISPKVKEYPRESMLGFSKISETGGEKKMDDPLVTQENQKMLTMEKDCYNQIKSQETNLGDEERQLKEEPITLEKTLHDKARERYKETMKKSEEEVSREQAANDYLYPFLEKRNWIGKQAFQYQEAVELKNDVMSKLKERLLQRAEIIQKKLEDERHNLELAEQQIQKKTEIDKNYENDINNITFKIDILEQRALRFEANALQKYEEMDRKLNEDPRLQALHTKK